MNGWLIRDKPTTFSRICFLLIEPLARITRLPASSLHMGTNMLLVLRPTRTQATTHKLSFGKLETTTCSILNHDGEKVYHCQER